jgi:hypothetical protein
VAKVGISPEQVLILQEDVSDDVKDEVFRLELVLRQYCFGCYTNSDVSVLVALFWRRLDYWTQGQHAAG